MPYLYNRNVFFRPIHIAEFDRRGDKIMDTINIVHIDSEYSGINDFVKS